MKKLFWDSMAFVQDYSKRSAAKNSKMSEDVDRFVLQKIGLDQATQDDGTPNLRLEKLQPILHSIRSCREFAKDCQACFCLSYNSDTKKITVTIAYLLVICSGQTHEYIKDMYRHACRSMIVPSQNKKILQTLVYDVSCVEDDVSL